MLRTQIIIAVTAAFWITGDSNARGAESPSGETNSKIFATTKLITSGSGQNSKDRTFQVAQGQIKHDKYPPPPKNSKVKRALRSSRCEGHIFEVNHYGKSGIELARENLDKYVAGLKKKSPRKKFRVVQDKPQCYKFLDLLLFDEWTCKIEAAICS